MVCDAEGPGREGPGFARRARRGRDALRLPQILLLLLVASPQIGGPKVFLRDAFPADPGARPVGVVEKGLEISPAVRQWILLNSAGVPPPVPPSAAKWLIESLRARAKSRRTPEDRFDTVERARALALRGPQLHGPFDRVSCALSRPRTGRVP